MKYFPLFIFILLCSCDSEQDDEFENLKSSLFKYTTDVSELPINADPPTGDYEDVRGGKFSFQLDSGKIQLLYKYRTELEPLVLQYTDSGLSWMYLAAYLKYESAIPKLKAQLLNCDKFYGWEGGDYSAIDRYLDDEQYCYQMSYVAAIEYIAQKPIWKAITLTEDERKKIEEKAKQCVLSDTLTEENCSARWLLEKLTGEKKRTLKEMLQGLWEDQPSGAAYFLINDDSIIYPHHDLSPAIYRLSGDTIFEIDMRMKQTYKKLVTRITADSLVIYDITRKEAIRLARRNK